MLASKVLLVANWYLHNFRLPLLRDLRAAGYQVEAVGPRDSYTLRLDAEGFTVHPWLMAQLREPPRKGPCPGGSAAHLRRERQDLVHHFTIKACL
jgi:hypothetical protein